LPLFSDMNNRINYLKAEFEQNPTDPFNPYALAIEYLATQPDEALALLIWLESNIANYLPTYYQLAGLWQEFGQLEKAEACYIKGIELAVLQQNPKTKDELEKALYNLRLEL